MSAPNTAFCQVGVTEMTCVALANQMLQAGDKGQHDSGINLPQALACLYAIHHGHFDIHEHGLVTFFAERLQKIDGITERIDDDFVVIGSCVLFNLPF